MCAKRVSEVDMHANHFSFLVAATLCVASSYMHTVFCDVSQHVSTSWVGVICDTWHVVEIQCAKHLLACRCLESRNY